MKISVITVAYNAAETILDTIKSVAGQSYSNIEYIIVDGGSNDGTVAIIKQHDEHIHAWVSEPDQGIYDAMNKGIAMATGDVIGILNADDIYGHVDVLQKVAEVFEGSNIDACFADLEFINNVGKVVRRYSSSRFDVKQLKNGWMPAHPTLYVRKVFYEQVGVFSLSYQIAADYEWVVRAFYTHDAKWCYIPEVWVNMRMGGASTQGWRSNWILNCEIVKACNSNGVKTSLLRVLMKIPFKILELRMIK